MADVAKLNVVVLWDHEIRIAAKACAELLKVVQDKESDQKVAKAAQHAFDACSVALYGAEDDNARLVLTFCPEEWKAK